MNAIFVTQALGLKLHHQLMRALAEPLRLRQVGFYLSDSMFFRGFLRQNPTFASAGFHLLKEWEIMAAARAVAVDPGYLRKIETELNGGPLWEALVCDRRIMQGRWCKERQDYRPRFSHDRLLGILQAGLQGIERLFEQVQPDVVFSLVPVTFGEYLASMVARAKGVPALYLYPTKIRNYMAWMSSFFGKPDHIVTAFREYEQTGRRDRWVEEAERYLASVGDGEVRHEGMIPIPGRIKAARPGRPLLGRLASLLTGELEYRFTDSRDDNHVTDPVLTFLHRRLLFRIRARVVNARLGPRYVRPDHLDRMDFAFYPLHAEPEVALAIHGRPYQNQIETVRNLARSLPVGMKLVVKEHPRCIGYRPFGYYEKLLRIPNVELADPFTESRVIVRRARLVAAVWSFVGFEGVIQKKPVVLLGTPPFCILPDSMVRWVGDLSRLHAEIADVLRRYEYRERSVAHYVAANMKGAVPMDFYARFLEKRGRYADASAEAGGGEFAAFVDYTLTRVREVCRGAERG
ncbi:MAG: hypothetical protein A3K12_08515 [Candidatus Rokubacteria bacterium RIFCSPLOWO2_12_FULL_71_19]|nr:MAG: hypothetical protein A3K12_08515 [Candidatus Rokubacteria bacterium RIFCSPLOWO2_12_FULL_71_19]